MSAVIEPAHLWVPDYEFTSGPEVADLSVDVGYPPDDNQRQALDVIFAEGKDRKPVAFEVGIICSRQNIKTSVMKQSSLGWLYLLGIGRVVYTAHDWNPVCADMFKEMKELIDGSDWLTKRTRRIYEGNGEEAIVLHSGATMLFKTRTKSGARGMAGDKVMFDEGFALQAAHMGSLVPILSTRPQAQIIYGSSPGKAESEVLRGVRDRGRARNDPQLAYIEFCAPDPAQACELGERCDHSRSAPGCGCDKPDLWRLANPATASGRITVEYIAKERRTLPPAEFARERMGWWDAPARQADERSPINVEAWRELIDDQPQNAPKRMPAFAVEVDVDQAFASIGAAGRCGDGVAFVEHVDKRRGTAWVVERCRQLNAVHGPATFAVDGGGPGERLIEPLRAAGLNVVVMSAKDVVAAVGDFIDDVEDGMVVHGPQRELDDAVEGARKRPLGERFALKRFSADLDITPLNAVIFARWLLADLDYDLDDSIL